MKKFDRSILVDIMATTLGCALFGLGFSVFLEPNGLSAGGISGLAMVFVHVTGFGTVGLISALMNVPLFIFGGLKIGKKFFVGSLFGMLLSSVMIDLFAAIPTPPLEPLVAGLYGGVVCGVGLGCIFAAGVSTGGSDIVVRLLKLRWRNVPIGAISIAFDAVVAILTGLMFRDLSVALYSGVAIFVTGKVIDVVVYRFDYSKVALIITKDYDAVVAEISAKLDRGATFLHGEGSYSHQNTKVILTAIKRQQLAELKELVVEIDSDAFIIVQEAHQVLGDGFLRYNKDSL